MKKFESGFSSLRELVIAALGAYGFWYQITQVRNPSAMGLVICGVMVGVPTFISVFQMAGRERATTDILRGEVREMLRDLFENELETKPTPRSRKR